MDRCICKSKIDAGLKSCLAWAPCAAPPAWASPSTILQWRLIWIRKPIQYMTGGHYKHWRLQLAALLLPDALFTATSSLECGLSWHWSGVDFSYSTATRSVSVYSSYLLHSLIPLLYNQIMFTSFILFQYKMKMEGEREYNKFWCAISCTGGAVPRLLPADVLARCPDQCCDNSNKWKYIST